MKLELTRVRNLKDVYYIKEYQYGLFKITVDIDIYDENKFMIQAKNNEKTCEIMLSSYDEQAVMNFPAAYITLENSEIFLESVKQGIEILKLIKENRNKLIKKI